MIKFERKLGTRSESLDCLVYALAARAALALTAAAFDQRETTLRKPTPEAAPSPAVIKSQWMVRGRWR